MDKKGLSIVIAYAGESQYLDEMMHSVLSNDHVLEILVGIDLSRISKEEALQNWNHWIDIAKIQNLKLELFFSAVPGPAAVRNLAIKHASSEFILPVDADDKISEDYVRLIIETFSLAKPNTGIVYGKAELFGDSSGEWCLPTYSKKGIVLENSIYATSGFRKCDWEKVGGYDEELIYGQEDWDLWLKIIGLGREVIFIDKTVFFYRIRANSRSVAFRGMWEQVIWTYDRICSSNKVLMASQVEEIYHRRVVLELENSTFKNVSKGFFVALSKKFPIIRKVADQKSVKAIRKKWAI